MVPGTRGAAHSAARGVPLTFASRVTVPPTHVRVLIVRAERLRSPGSPDVEWSPTTYCRIAVAARCRSPTSAACISSLACWS